MYAIIFFSALLFTLPHCSSWAGEAAPAPGGDEITSAFAPESWSFHHQATIVTQGHPGFHSPYSGPNSLIADEKPQSSVTATLFFGRRLWDGGEAYVNPELSGGAGFSKTTGLAGFPNGEIYRVDDARPKWSLARLYLRQTFGFGGEQEKLEADQNQLARMVDVRRFTLVAGKFALNDFLDANSYTHDPRTQFLNWAMMDHGAWDYAADTRGYTWGILFELNQPAWALRFASAAEPYSANQLRFDTQFPQVRGDNLEFEYRYQWRGRKGVGRVLAFDNHARMGNYRLAVEQAASGALPDVTSTRSLRSKIGFGFNLEQEIGPELGAFLKTAWADGSSETWAFTEIERSLAAGLSLKGNRWKREHDTVGLALMVNGLAAQHRQYIENGGNGFILGDGKLNYGPEEILEAYYLFQVSKPFGISPDFQFVNHPAYNRDRGPLAIISARLHYAL